MHICKYIEIFLAEWKDQNNVSNNAKGGVGFGRAVREVRKRTDGRRIEFQRWQ
jgi:hypothetical protein